MVDEKELDMIDKANLVAQRLEKANAEHKEILKREEEMESRRILGGQTSAGNVQPVQMTEEDKIKAEGRIYFKGGLLEGVFK